LDHYWLKKIGDEEKQKQLNSGLFMVTVSVFIMASLP